MHSWIMYSLWYDLKLYFIFKGEVNVINKEKQFSNVFVYAASIVGFLVVIGAILPKQFGEITGMMSAWVSTTFGWYYMLLYTVILGFTIFLVFSPIGKIGRAHV